MSRVKQTNLQNKQNELQSAFAEQRIHRILVDDRSVLQTNHYTILGTWKKPYWDLRMLKVLIGTFYIAIGLEIKMFLLSYRIPTTDDWLTRNLIDTGTNLFRG